MKKTKRRRLKKKNRQRRIMFIVIIGIILIIVFNKNKNEKNDEKTMETAMSINTSNEQRISNEEKRKPEISSKTTDWNLF